MTKWQMIEKLWQKYEIDKFLKIERFELCKICYRLSTKWLSFRSKWSDFDETGLYKFVITNGEKFQISRNLRNYGISKPWAKSAPPLLWLRGLNTLSWTMNFDDTLSVITLNEWNGGIIEPTLICLIHFYKKLVYR